MISRGSWRLSRKCANGKRRRPPARLAPWPPRTQGPRTKSRRRSAPGRPPARRRPGVGEGGRRASRVTCERRGPGRCPGALAPVAHLARRRRQPGGGGAPGPGGGAAGGPRRGARLPGGGLGPAPEAISFCASHMKAASRAPGPRCRRRRGERQLHCAGSERAAAAAAGSPRAPGGAAPASAPQSAPGLRSLPSQPVRPLCASQARRPRVRGVCRARAV